MKIRKKHLLIGTTLYVILGLIYLYVDYGFGFWYNGTLALVTIGLPVIGGLYVFKGKLARIVLGLAVLSLLCGLILAVDLMASVETFKAACTEVGGDFKVWDTNSMLCSMGSETETFYGTPFSHSLVQSVAFYGMVVGLFGGLINGFVLLGVMIRRLFKRR